MSQSFSDESLLRKGKYQIFLGLYDADTSLKKASKNCGKNKLTFALETAVSDPLSSNLFAKTFRSRVTVTGKTRLDLGYVFDF